MEMELKSGLAFDTVSTAGCLNYPNRNNYFEPSRRIPIITEPIIFPDTKLTSVRRFCLAHEC